MTVLVCMLQVLNSGPGRSWVSESYNPVPGISPGVPAAKVGHRHLPRSCRYLPGSLHRMHPTHILSQPPHLALTTTTLVMSMPPPPQGYVGGLCSGHVEAQLTLVVEEAEACHSPLHVGRSVHALYKAVSRGEAGGMLGMWCEGMHVCICHQVHFVG